MPADTPGDKPNCSRCAFYYVTWNPKFPRGCRAYGFKGREWPTSTVLRASGKPCLQYKAKR